MATVQLLAVLCFFATTALAINCHQCQGRACLKTNKTTVTNCEGLRYNYDGFPTTHLPDDNGRALTDKACLFAGNKTYAYRSCIVMASYERVNKTFCAPSRKASKDFRCDFCLDNLCNDFPVPFNDATRMAFAFPLLLVLLLNALGLFQISEPELYL